MNDVTLNTKNNTYLFLQSNNNQYMIASEYVEKIVILQNLECPKSLPKHVIGLLEDKDELINVVDLKSILKLEAKPYPLNSKIIIVNYNDMKLALIADSVTDIRKVKPNLIKNTPYNDSEIINKIYSPKNDTGTMIISISAVFNTLKKILDENIFEDNKENLLPQEKKELEVLKSRALNIKQERELKLLPANSNSQYTTFKIGGSIYCIKNASIKEFFKVNKTKITKIPSTPDFIKGIINIKGDFICVLDIQNYLNRGKLEINEKTNVIVLNSDSVKLGILTNGIDKNMSFENIEFNSKDYIDFVQDDKVYCILNIENIINSEKIFVC